MQAGGENCQAAWYVVLCCRFLLVAALSKDERSSSTSCKGRSLLTGSGSRLDATHESMYRAAKKITAMNADTSCTKKPPSSGTAKLPSCAAKAVTATVWARLDVGKYSDANTSRKLRPVAWAANCRPTSGPQSATWYFRAAATKFSTVRTPAASNGTCTKYFRQVTVDKYAAKTVPRISTTYASVSIRMAPYCGSAIINGAWA
mmetsp:Transcript_45834/g.127167  ORF Transcript_45834/g.127167 Transcript_45834/m.127167 type:complete len:203 (+) Transcript_45834:45-653(+)